MRLTIVLIGFAAIAAVNLPGMIREKLWKELAKYLWVYLAVLLLGVLIALDVHVPSPIQGMMSLYRNVLHLSFKMS